VVDKLATEEVFLRELRFSPLTIIPPMLHTRKDKRVKPWKLKRGMLFQIPRIISRCISVFKQINDRPAVLSQRRPLEYKSTRKKTDENLVTGL
jgi:hypothetical protein